MEMDDKKTWKGWFSTEILKALMWFIVISSPATGYFFTKYIELEVSVARIEASAVKADDLKNLRDDIRHAIQDGNKAITERLASDENRISNLEVRK